MNARARGARRSGSRVLCLLATTAAGLAGCDAKPVGPCAEVVAVYAAALEAVTADTGRRSRVVVLRADASGRPRKAPESVPAELLDDYVAAQAAMLAANCDSALAREFELIDRRTLERIFSDGEHEGWSRFETSYSASGYWTLSGLGFCTNGSQALCLITFHHGREGGPGHFVHLERRKGRWTAIGTAPAWIG